MKVQLKACPFCGQDTAALYCNYSGRSDKYFTWVECDICGARSKAATSDDDPSDGNKWDNRACHKAAAAWNARREA